MREVRPYLVPEEGVVSNSAWFLNGDEVRPLPEYLEGWDPDTNLELERIVTVDLRTLAQQCGLDNDEDLTLTVSWTATSSDMVEVGYSSLVKPDQSVRIVLPGARVGGALDIRTTVSLANRRPNARAGTVRWEGSILSQHVQRLTLQGQGAMFPVSSADFAGTPYGAYASWTLQTSTELETPFMGGFLLLLNSRDLELHGAISADSKSPRQDLLLDQLEAGVAALLIELALDLREELADRDWPAGSTGEVLDSYLKVATKRALELPSTGPDRVEFRSRLESVVREESWGRLFT